MNKVLSLGLTFILTLIFADLTVAQVGSSQNNDLNINFWHDSIYGTEFFKGRIVGGNDAITYLMQAYNWRSNPENKPERRSKIELLLSNDTAQIALANKLLTAEARIVIKDPVAWKKKNRLSKIPTIWIELLLRVPSKFTLGTKRDVITAIKSLNLSGEDAGYVATIGNAGSNGANVYGYLTPLTLAPNLINDQYISVAREKALKSELDFLNRSGDLSEFNVLESHWTGVASWAIIKKYVSDPNLQRIARLISERVWINRFLTWSPAVERNTGPGSRAQPIEWLGADYERAIFATALKRPIWLNMFFPWDYFNPRDIRQVYEEIPTEVSSPDLPQYLQDIALYKPTSDLLQSSMVYKKWRAYPSLPGQPEANPDQPKKYINYQTTNYTIGSTTSSWITNDPVVAASAWWNDNLSVNAPLGSPKRFCVLYPHYVFNGMSTFDRGNIFFENNPANPLKDSRTNSNGPWLGEFADYGRVGTLQDSSTLVISYSPKPGTSLNTIEKSKVFRASAAMFLFRWTERLDGLFINKTPVQKLPLELSQGERWFIDAGDVYAAVLPLKATSLKGKSKITLEKRNHQIVLYCDNVNADNILGISDEAWAKARAGFVIEMGNKERYGSFENFQNQILNTKVISDQQTDFDHHIHYKAKNHELEMIWNAYTEDYAVRKINNLNDEWTKFLSSPRFAVTNNGLAKVNDAQLITSPGRTIWLLSCPMSKTWVAYQPNSEYVLPLKFISPVGLITIRRFPLGKITIGEVNNVVNIQIDASYVTDKRDTGKYNIQPIEFELNNKNAKVNFSINGVKYSSSMMKQTGKSTFIIDPAARLNCIKQTMIEKGMQIPH